MDLEYLIEVTGHHYSPAAAATALLTGVSSATAAVNQSITAAAAATALSEGASKGNEEGEGEVKGEEMSEGKGGGGPEGSSLLLEILAETDLRRVCGNRWFSYGDFPKAGRSYAKGVKIAQNYFQNEPEQEPESECVVESGAVEEGKGEEGKKGKEGKEIICARKSEIARSKEQLMIAYISCLNNLSACHLSMKEYVKTKEACVRVLEVEPDNVKALIRAAKASLALHEYDECALCLESVSNISLLSPSLPHTLSLLLFYLLSSFLFLRYPYLT